ncbi:Fibronectin-binding protein A N-terminus (FbpA) [seawater metagenome]|uniref:Fibronectin-binding protein A N-terminus (FbpA) n=1 Tax=seawater metagenome TaxID=1561972 RepID=A0A5E8CJD2_9ZZZZ
MVKQKLNASDVFVLIKEFKTKLMNARVNNIYDINSRCFLLKLTSENKEKYFVLLDSNPQCPRFQITNQNFERRIIPSSFCTKLRKHLTNKKITNIRQLGSDRVIDIQFGSDNKFNLIMELYDSGNLILTDNSYKILTLVRRYSLEQEEEENLVIKVGVIYPTDQESLDINSITNQDIRSTIEKSFENGKKTSLRNIFISHNSPIVNLGKDIVFHCIHSLNWSPNKKITLEAALDFPIDNFLDLIKVTMEALNEATGYIIYKDETKQEPDDFVPLLYSHVSDKTYQEFPDLSTLLDTYFKSKVSIETKEVKKSIQKENKIEEEKNKIERLKENINNRLNEFEEKKNTNLEIANYLSQNLEEFNFLHTFDPDNYSNSNILEIDKRNKTCTYCPTGTEFKIKLDYTQNIWNNIKKFHSNKKQIKEKIIKTSKGGAQAIESMLKEQKKKDKKKKNIIADDLKEKLDNMEIKDLWFQKFRWFITSEGFLVLLGKDMHQNELLVKRYLNKNDIYLHSDTHGSGSCVIKNIIKSSDEIPSPISITQAASFIICHSKAWNYNSPDKAFWVYEHQVSKTPESGEYLPTGSFIIRGKKNYVITNLQLGLSFLFKKEGELIEQNLKENCKDNNVEWAIPIIAPYNALKDTKFKAKITPGKNKKGKAYKAIIDNFCSKKDALPIEKYLIRRVKDGADYLPSSIYFSFTA